MGAVVIAYQNRAGERRRVSLDVETDLVFEGKSELSAFPLQSGGSFQDHKTNLPDVFTMTGIVSKTPSLRNPGAVEFGSVSVKKLTLPPLAPRPNYPPIQYPTSTPSRPPANLVGGARVLFGKLEQPQPTRTPAAVKDSRPTEAHGFWNDASKFENRCQIIHEELEQIRKEAFDCEIITQQRSGSGFQLVQVTATITGTNGERCDFQLAFSKLQETELRKADVPIPAEILATPVSRSGSQAAKTDAEAKEEGKKESIAHQLIGDGAGAVGAAIRNALGG